MIPNRYHFIWFGRDFPLTHALAIRSVAATCAPEAIVLHASDDLRGRPHFDQLVAELPAFTVQPIDIGGLLDGPDLPDPTRLRQIWDQLSGQRRWAQLADLLRHLVLYSQGGVYLDLDTLTLRDMRPLLGTSGFCGRERILVDAAVHRRRSPLRYFRTVPLDLARWICSRTENGIRYFARIAKLYRAAINNAVLALSVRHPLALEALGRIPGLIADVDRRRPALGPDLLQDLIDGAGRNDITVFGPSHFYPLGPQMAAQIFRVRATAADVNRALGESIGSETYVLHWYNDSRKPSRHPLDRASIQALADRQMFSRLACPFLPAEPAANGTP